MKKFIALILAVGMVAPSCAAAREPRVQVQSQVGQSARERELLSEFARQLPAGARVRASVAGDRVIRGTLIKATDTSVVIQPKGRVPEPIVEVGFANLLALEQEQPGGGGTGRAVAIGAAAGAGAALGVLLLLIALLGD
jgi:hypothetical protein